MDLPHYSRHWSVDTLGEVKDASVSVNRGRSRAVTVNVYE